MVVEGPLDMRRCRSPPSSPFSGSNFCACTTVTRSSSINESNGFEFITAVAQASPSGARAAPTSLRGIRGVCFDIDGTLCESDPLHLKYDPRIRHL